MPTEGICRCGHPRYMHRGGPLPPCLGSRLGALPGGWRVPGVPPCQCQAFDDSVLPADGERLEFGRHRQPSPAAETAPAWPSATELDARSTARFRRFVKGADRAD